LVSGAAAPFRWIERAPADQKQGTDTDYKDFGARGFVPHLDCSKKSDGLQECAFAECRSRNAECGMRNVGGASIEVAYFYTFSMVGFHLPRLKVLRMRVEPRRPSRIEPTRKQIAHEA
jgi:hypothetical protein